MACNCNIHLTPECTALSPAAITGIKDLGMNAMLLCNNCVEQNERDNFIRCRILAKVTEKIDSLGVGEKLKNMERRLTDLVVKKIGNATNMMCDKLEKKNTVKNTLISEKINSILPNSCVACKITLNDAQEFLYAFYNPPISSSYRYTI